MRVAFVFSEYSLHNNIIADYHQARPSDELFVIKVPLLLKGKSRIESAQKILPKASVNFVLAKVWEFLALGIITLMPKLLPYGPVFRRLSSIATRVHAQYLYAENIMDPAVVEKIKQWSPDLIVTLFHQIIREPLISIPRCGVINIHPGLLPDFRGIQPYFWSLATGAPESGVTMHLIKDETVDTGPILGQARHPLWPGMSVQLNYYLTCKSAASLLPQLVCRLEEGELSSSPQPPGGNYYSWPTEAAYRDLQRRGHRVLSIPQLIGIVVGRF